MNPGIRLRSHVSTITIILANILTIAFAIVYKWDIADVLWIYWAQSLIIGIFHFFTILEQKQFSTEGFERYSQPIPATISTLHKVAGFFIFHYVILHLIFLAFLVYLWELTPSMSALNLALCIVAFLGAHSFSYWKNRRKFADTRQNIWWLMFYPYARIIPMWLTLTVGINFARDYSITLITFLILKTCADVIMHVLEVESTIVDERNNKPDIIPIKEENEELTNNTYSGQNKPLYIWTVIKIELKEAKLLKSWQNILYIVLTVALMIFLIITIVYFDSSNPRYPW